MGFKMNIYIGWLFKLIPLLMGIICIALGEFVLTGSGQSEYFVAGHVLISLSAICLALFTTAFIIISQLTHGMNKFYNRLFRYWLCRFCYNYDLGMVTVGKQ